MANTSRFAAIRAEKFSVSPHCHYCGRKTWNGKKHGKGGAASRCTIDHIIPQSHGGRNSADNLVIACYQCNQLRSNIDYETFRREIKNGKHNIGKLRREHKDRVSYRAKLRNRAHFAYIS